VKLFPEKIKWRSRLIIIRRAESQPEVCRRLSARLVSRLHFIIIFLPKAEDDVLVEIFQIIVTYSDHCHWRGKKTGGKRFNRLSRY